MKPKPLSFLFVILFAAGSLFSSCDAVIEPSISKKNVQLEAPVDQYLSTSYTVNFWWDEVEHALSYHLQVVTPNFGAPGSLVLDTIVKSYKFSYNLAPGNYQWRVMAENGSSQTPYTSPRNFTVAASSIKQQSVQLVSPANSYLTNQKTFTFQWGNLYGATQYRFEIDTSNFAMGNAVVSDIVIPGQQISFTFPKDQTYQWRVRAENDTAQAQWSVVNTITYDHTPPAQVSLASPANNVTVNKPVSLQWNAASTAVHYKLYVFKNDSVTLYNSNFPLVVNATNYSFNLGNSGDKIYWQVTAVDAAGNEGPASTMRSFTLQ
jgi:hypothetical protein